MGKRKLTDFEYDALISEVQCRPCLWNDRHEDFKNTAVTKELWDEVGNIINLSGNECKKKWKNLKDTFRKKVQTPPPKSTSSTPLKKWKFETPLEFIREVLPNGGIFTNPSAEEEHEIDESNDIEQQASCPEDDDRPSRSHRSKRRQREDPPPKRTMEVEVKSTNSGVLNIVKQTYDDMGDDHHFFLSLLPYVSRLDDLEKLQLRAKIQNCVLEAVSEHETRKMHYSTDNESSSNASRIVPW